MRKLCKSIVLLLVVGVLLLCAVSCDKKHASDEVVSICEQGLTYVDEFLNNETDVKAAYTKLYTLYAFWNELDIESDKDTMTRNFQAKSTYQDLLHAFESQASGEDVRSRIAALRNTLAGYTGLKKVDFDK